MSCINSIVVRIFETFPQKQFFMLGIIHQDSRNDEVISNWLENVRPGVVTLELSPYGLAFRREKGRQYLGRLAEISVGLRMEGYECSPSDLASFCSYVSFPREFVVAFEYCGKNQGHLYPIDMDFFSYMKLRKIDELICAENIEKSLSGRQESAASTQRVLADIFFESGVVAFSYDEEMALRDSFMCNRISTLMKRFSDKRFLHITGWQHLPDPYDFYARFKPVKIYPYD